MKCSTIALVGLVVLPSVGFTQADLTGLYMDMRCDQSLDMIATAINDERSYFGEAEAREINAFLLGFGLLAKFKHPENAKEAIGAAYGALVWACEDEPSKTIFELSERRFRD